MICQADDDEDEGWSYKMKLEERVIIRRPDIATSTWSYSEQQDEIELFHWNLHSNINIEHC